MPDQMILHYRVVRRLGTGGMGEVLLAQDTKLERSVAIKLMSAELARDPDQRKRFRQEARAASGLVHPNICVIHEVGETEDGRPFLAMEYVAGQTLDVIAQQRRMRIREIVRVGIQVAEALEAARTRGLVHRDIKPSNLMLDERGNVKVLDFGLAKNLVRDALADASDTSVLLTRTGILLGTPHYMSPEQALGRPVDHRSDIFSLGVILYELIVGQRPFLGKTVGEIINNIVNQEPEPLSLENPVYAPALDGIVLKCLAKDPDKRYAAAKDLAADLQQLKLESELAATLARAQTPTGIPKPPTTSILQSAPPRARSPGTLVAISAAVAVVLGAAAYFGLAWLPAHKARPQITAHGNEPAAKVIPPKSIAVLPFDNFSAEKDSDYLSDGLTEEITSALSRIPGLKVAARNSAFAFKGHKEDLRKVGATLGVATLLEGSLRKVGNQMRVTTQLISAADGYNLWSDSYDRPLNDLFAVEAEIARQIAERLQVEITGGAKLPARSMTENTEAHTLYLQAKHFWNKRTKEDLDKAAQLFNQAIDKDPTYGAAYAGLATCYVLLPQYSLRPTSEYAPQARAAATRALALDDSSAEAHTALAMVKEYSRDMAGSEEQYKEAIRLNPNFATAHQWYGALLSELGRTNDALVELSRAEELDPLSPIIKANLLTCYYYARQYDRAIAECRSALELFPDFPQLRVSLATFYTQKGQFKEALAEMDKARATGGDSPEFLEMIGYISGRSGDESRARAVLGELQQWLKKGYDVRGGIAGVYAGLREYDQAIDWMSQALDANEYITGLLCDPAMDDLRANPRFLELLRKAGLKS